MLEKNLKGRGKKNEIRRVGGVVSKRTFHYFQFFLKHKSPFQTKSEIIISEIPCWTPLHCEFIRLGCKQVSMLPRGWCKISAP